MFGNHIRMKMLAVVAAICLVVSAFMYKDINTPRSIPQTMLGPDYKISTLVQSNPMAGPGHRGESPEVIRILYATGCFVNADWLWGVGSAPLSACPHMIGRCEFTRDWSLANKSHALLFHMRNGVSLPSFRPPQQKWIFAIRESPVHTYKNLKAFQNVFNLTMTYVHSAMNNVDWSYGSCLSKADGSRLQLDGDSDVRAINTVSAEPLDANYARGKKHLVAWFVSNCKTQSRREKYVMEMQKHGDVHIYGCGPYKCPKSKGEFCYDVLLKNDYKFYLSFENSFCKDYVTKKLWRVMSVDIVPVVLGHANYSRWLPAHSYIDVRDYASPKHLVDYLKRLDANDMLYNEYFRWKTRYRCGVRNVNNACELCRYLHEAYGRQQRVDDIFSRWSTQQNCIDPMNFYRTLGVDVEAWQADAKSSGKTENPKKDKKTKPLNSNERKKSKVESNDRQ